MRTLAFVCFALSAGVAVVSLAACGGSQSAAVLAPNEAPDTLPNHKTFKYRGTEQSFSVPAGVTSITVVARGAAGGGRGSEDAPRADGGRVYAVIPVTPEETLYVVVGGRGTRKAGGYNGGGKPGTDYYSHGFGGGGASDVREGGDMRSMTECWSRAAAEPRATPFLTDHIRPSAV